MSNEVKTTEIPHQRAEIRRFAPADLSEQGHWIMKRLQLLLPDLGEHFLGSWLRGMIYDNSHLFLYQKNGVALFQVVTLPSIKLTKVIQERFVWVADPRDVEQCRAAGDFYEDALTWAKGLRLDRIFVCENSDVPKSEIEKRVGRIFNATISHVRV